MPALPTELIEQILGEFHPYASIDSQDLLRISRVNRAWHAVARQRLYKTVYVQSPKDEVLQGFWGMLEQLGRLPGPRETVDEDWDDSDDEGNIGEGVPAEEPARLSMDVTSQRLWQVLNENESVASIVEEIVFQGPFETDHAANAIRRFLWVCPNLRSFRLIQHQPTFGRGFPGDGDEDATEPSDRVFTHLWKMRPNLKSLDVGLASDQAISVISLFHEWKDLEHVRLRFQEEDALGCELDDEVYDFEPEYRLKSLSMGLVLEPELFDRITRSSRDSLESLSTYVRRRALDLSKFSQLKQVTLHGGDNMWKAVGDTLAMLPPEVESVEIIGNMLISNLDRVRGRRENYLFHGPEHAETVSSRRRRQTHPDEFTFATLLRRIRAHVTRFSLGDFPAAAESSALVAALGDRTWLPNLRSLAVPDEIYANFGDLADREEGGEGFEPGSYEDSTAKGIRKEQSALDAACKARGVRFFLRKRSWQERINEDLPPLPRIFQEPFEGEEEEDDELEDDLETGDEWDDFGSDRESMSGEEMEEDEE